jgi:hypothetical protein
MTGPETTGGAANHGPDAHAHSGTAPVALVRIPFYEGYLLAVGGPFTQEGDRPVPLRPFCEGLGLTLAPQLVKLRRVSWTCVSIIDMQMPGDDQARPTATIPLRALAMWLASINPGKVRPELRPILVRYQTEATETLYRRFLAPPSLSPEQEARLDPHEAVRLADELLYLRTQTARLEASLGLRPPSEGALWEVRERLERLESRAGLPWPRAPLPPWLPPPKAALTATTATDSLASLRAQVDAQREWLARLAHVVGFDAGGCLPDFTHVPRVDWESTGVARVRAWLLDCTRPLTDEERRRRRWQGLSLREMAQSFEAWAEGRQLGAQRPSHLPRFLGLCGVQRRKTAGGVRYALAWRTPSTVAVAEVRHVG